VAALSARDASLDFEAVYRDWYGPVVRWARRLGGNASDCEDLAQEVFVVVKRRLSAFDGEHLAAWLYRITRGRVRDHRRLKWSQAVGGGLTPELLIEEGSGPLEALETKQRYAILERRWSRLNDDERAALMLLELQGCSGEEIALTLKVPLNTVWSRIRRARLKLSSPALRRAYRPNPSTSERPHVASCM
jgi:RNA polymerase sigma-70 factor, ECF subfamily